MTLRTLEKVTTFITRGATERADAPQQLLLFRHESAGIQIPAGTVEVNEDPAVAARREAGEETGLRGLSVPRLLAVQDDPPPEGYCFVYTTTRVYARPYDTSFQWAQVRRGLMVREERRSGDYVQITYAEMDQVSDPTYVSYQITGWVPATVLAWHRRRSFYVLDCLEQTPETWLTHFDGPRFTLFWADLRALPPIVAPQAAWIEVLLAHL